MKNHVLSFFVLLIVSGLAHANGAEIGDLPMLPADKEGRVMAYEIAEPDAKALYYLLDVPEQARDVGFYKDGKHIQCDRSHDLTPRYSCYFFLGFKPKKGKLTGSAEPAVR